MCLREDTQIQYSDTTRNVDSFFAVGVQDCLFAWIKNRRNEMFTDGQMRSSKKQEKCMSSSAFLLSSKDLVLSVCVPRHPLFREITHKEEGGEEGKVVPTER